MKQILTLTIFLLALQVNAQVTQEWVARYKGPGNPGYNFPTAIDVDNQGNIYVAGYSRIGDNTSTNIEIATIKYNSDGLEQWIRRYGGLGSSSDEARAIAIDTLGNVYVTGISIDSLWTNITTIKYSPEGNELWVQKYNRTGDGNEGPTAIAVDGTGSVYVTGYCVRPGITDYDFVTLKYNSNGVQQWVKFYNGPVNGNDFSKAIAIDNQDNIYVTGSSRGVGNHIDYVTIKYNSSGTQLWVERYSGSGPAQGANAVTVDNNGNVYITGSLRNTENNTDYVTIKYDTNGILKWFQIYNEGNSNEAGRFIAVDEYSNVYVAGNSNSGVSFATIKYDSTGAFQWVQTYSGPNGTNNSLTKMVIDNLGNIYLTGGENNLSNSESKFITIKYDFDGVQKWLQTYQHPSIFQSGSSMAMAIDEQQNIYITGFSIDNPDVDYATIKYSQTTPLVFTKPALNEKWMAGETDTIKWTGGFPGEDVEIWFSTDDFVTHNLISLSTPVNDKQFIWTIPDTVLSTKVKIKFIYIGNPGFTEESEIFRIKPYLLTRIDENGDYYGYRKDRDQWGFSNEPEDMWPQTWYNQFNYQGTDPFTNRQYSQWQGDSVFFKIAPTPHAHMDWISWVNTFSVDACYIDANLGLYSPTALLKWWSNLEVWNGSCFGIAVANALAFSHKEQFQSKYQNFPDSLNPITVVSDTGVKRVVNELFTHQLGNPHLAYRANVGLKKTPKETLIELLQMFKEDDAQIRTLSFNNNNGDGGHAILAYGLECNASREKLQLRKNNVC